MAANKRLNLLERVHSLYQELSEKHEGQWAIAVVVASIPSDEAIEVIEHKLGSACGRDAKVFFSKDQ